MHHAMNINSLMVTTLRKEEKMDKERMKENNYRI